MVKEEENKNERGGEKDPLHFPALSPASRTRSSFKDKLLMALIIIGVVSLGLFAINQFTSWRYKNLLLQTPCDLCINLNPHLESCLQETEINKNKIIYNFTLPS